MIGRMIVGVASLVFVAGCAGRVDRGRPFQMQSQSAPVSQSAPQQYVWARNDGRRMADDPALLRQGQKDQADCTAESVNNGILDQPAFITCMQGRGYSRRPVS